MGKCVQISTGMGMKDGQENWLGFAFMSHAAVVFAPRLYRTFEFLCTNVQDPGSVDMSTTVGVIASHLILLARRCRPEGP